MVSCPTVPNLRHLRMLQMVGQLKSITLASRALNASQTAVTKAVLNFEKDVSATLFERRSTGTFPTEIGQLFLNRVDRFFDIAETAIRSATGQPTKFQKQAPKPIEQLMTATQMRSFIMASDADSLSVAPQESAASKVSLFRTIRTLEWALGQSLFIRNASGPVCNDIGQELARQLAQAIREIEYGRSEIKVAQDEEDTEIVIGSLALAGSFELATAISDFVRSRPNARVKVVNGSYWSLLNDLRHCRIDMLFGRMRKPDWVTDVVEEPYFRDVYCFVTGSQHPLARKSKISLADLAAYDWIVPETGTPLRRKIDELFEGRDDKPGFSIETRSLTIIRALLHCTDMITVMCRSEMRFDANTGFLKCIDFPLPESIATKGIATRSNWLPTEAHRSFLDYMRQSAARADYEKGYRRVPLEAIAS